MVTGNRAGAGRLLSQSGRSRLQAPDAAVVRELHDDQA
jgi:hypothetical protein